jgi:hypothetical protein
MVSDGIKAAQTQTQYSPLIGGTQTAIRVNHHRAGRRPLGRYATSGRTLLSRNVPRLPAPVPSAPSLS